MNSNRFNLFFAGSLTIELRGKQLDTCLSEFHRSSIRLNGVKVRDGKCICTICVQDFRSVYRICRKYGVKMRFLSRDGFPFLLRNSGKRKSLVIGMFLFVGLLLFFSSMVWRVEITGGDEDTTAAIRQAARTSGLYMGAFKWRFPSVDQLSKNILSQTPNLIWVGVHLDGSTVSIQAIEKIEGVKENTSTPQNVVAAKPAVIVKMFATRGKVEVKSGQFVQPGQVLISGSLAEGQTLVPAEGQSIGEVWYVSKVQVPFRVNTDGLTGEYVKREYLDLGGAMVRIWGWKEPDFGLSVERESSTHWHLSGFTLPLQLKTVTEYQVQKSIGTRTLRAVEAEAQKLASQDVQGQMGKDGKVVGQTVLHQEVSHGTLYETVLTKTNEDIGVASPIETKQSETDTFPNPQA
jgi:similar to stage IV sporulation protein